MNNISDILQNFESITLEQMDTVKLQDRMDTKFVFSSVHLTSILQKLSESYKVLEIKGNRISKYETLYFDTPDFSLYTKHQNEKTNRYKLRIRKYVESDLIFFEIKFKNNKGRTIKDRIRIKEIKDVLQKKESDFLKEKTNLNPEDFGAKICVNYSRLTLVNEITNERLTIDVDLSYKKEGRVYPLSNLVIAELKQKKTVSSYFGKVMKELNLHQSSMSKYCIGIASTYNNVKKNNFKPNLIFINKIANAS